jgi:hypothetical protein
MTMNVSRRSLLALGAGLGASTFLGGSALAKAPKLGTQTPYWHRFVLGDAEVTIVSDGTLPLGPPKGTFVGVPDEEVRKMLSDNFLNPDNVVLEQNSPIVNSGDKLILFDTGMGTSKAFGPTTGRQQEEHGGSRDQAGRYRRRGAVARSYRSYRRHRRRRRQAVIPQRPILHHPERLRVLDR